MKGSIVKYPDQETLIQKFQLTSYIIHKQTEGISDEESVLQLPFRGNCMNWILGHILTDRSYVLQLLGMDAVMDEISLERYRRESEPVTSLDDGLRFHQLMEFFDLSQAKIEEGLKKVTAERLAEADRAGSREGEVGSLIADIHWHETYHTGQFEILRQLAGKNDKVI